MHGHDSTPRVRRRSHELNGSVQSTFVRASSSWTGASSDEVVKFSNSASEWYPESPKQCTKMEITDADLSIYRLRFRRCENGIFTLVHTQTFEELRIPLLELDGYVERSLHRDGIVRVNLIRESMKDKPIDDSVFIGDVK